MVNRRNILIALIAAATFSGCAANPPVQLNSADRAALKEAPAIHVVRYHSVGLHLTTPKDVVGAGLFASATGSAELPSGYELERAYKFPNASEVLSNQLVQKLKAEGRLANLRVESAPLPLPWMEDVAHYRNKYPGALVLEIEAMHGAHYQAMNWKTYNYSMFSKVRLIRVADGKILWQDLCNAGGDDLTLDVSEFEANSGARLKQLIPKAGDRCSRVLADKFFGKI
jgi:hypothetical protein